MSPPEADDQHVGPDNYLNGEIKIPCGKEDDIEKARAKRRALDMDNKPIGRHTKNPLLDICTY